MSAVMSTSLKVVNIAAVCCASTRLRAMVSRRFDIRTRCSERSPAGRVTKTGFGAGVTAFGVCACTGLEEPVAVAPATVPKPAALAAALAALDEPPPGALAEDAAADGCPVPCPPDAGGYAEGGDAGAVAPTWPATSRLVMRPASPVPETPAR